MTETEVENANSLVRFREEMPDDGFSVEYEILPAYDESDFSDERRNHIAAAISDIDAQSAVLEEKIAKLNTDIDRLTNHADGFDYGNL